MRFPSVFYSVSFPTLMPSLSPESAKVQSTDVMTHARRNGRLSFTVLSGANMMIHFVFSEKVLQVSSYMGK